MEVISKFCPWLEPLPYHFPKSLIGFRFPRLCVCVPPPPWSTVDDLDETSSLVERRAGQEWITWDEDLPIDGFTRFRMLPRSETIEECRRCYVVSRSRRPMRNSRAEISLGVYEDQATVRGIDIFRDPFGLPTVAIAAFCQIRSGHFYASLEHIEWFDAFNINDASNWPISRKEMIVRRDKVAKLQII